jgi:hypothetical protein
MTAPLWVRELAETFWREAGVVVPFPRSLREAALRTSFELTIKELSSLSIDTVENHLAHQGIHWRCGAADRPLHACLFAFEGAGWIFLDRDDQQRERNWSLAHELAHFLRHYWQLRQRAVEALGKGILDALDGRRSFLPGERLRALLRSAPSGAHVHLMHRDAVAVPPDVAQAEREADRLAWELLAPADEVLAQLGDDGGFDEAVTLLEDVFGLPPVAAQEYANALFPEEEDSPIVLSLKKMLNARRDRAR